MSRNVMAGLSAFLIVIGIVGLSEVETLPGILASGFAVVVGFLGAKESIL
jgi:hypothetical protein